MAPVGTTLSSFDYRYDTVNNPTCVTEANGSLVTFLYDKVLRLTREQRTGVAAYVLTHTYDTLGNRLTKTVNGVRTTYGYDSANQLLTQQDNTGRTTFLYDNNGNRTRKLTPSGDLTTYTWDYENQLTQIRLPAGVPNTMQYDADGKRVQKQDSGGTAKFVWDGQNILLQADQNNITQTLYTLQPADYGNLISQRASGATLYYHFDRLGSTDRLTDDSATVRTSYVYDAFGGKQLTSGTTTPFQWIGQLGYYYDPDSVQYQLRARAYDPATVLFFSRDPRGIAAGESALYHYGKDQPTTQVDPSGLANLSLPNWRVPSGQDVSNFAQGFSSGFSQGVQPLRAGGQVVLGTAQQQWNQGVSGATNVVQNVTQRFPPGVHVPPFGFPPLPPLGLPHLPGLGGSLPGFGGDPLQRLLSQALRQVRPLILNRLPAIYRVPGALSPGTRILSAIREVGESKVLAWAVEQVRQLAPQVLPPSLLRPGMNLNGFLSQASALALPTLAQLLPGAAGTPGIWGSGVALVTGSPAAAVLLYSGSFSLIQPTPQDVETVKLVGGGILTTGVIGAVIGTAEVWVPIVIIVVVVFLIIVMIIALIAMLLALAWFTAMCYDTQLVRAYLANVGDGGGSAAGEGSVSPLRLLDVLQRGGGAGGMNNLLLRPPGVNPVGIETPIGGVLPCPFPSLLARGLLRPLPGTQTEPWPWPERGPGPWPPPPRIEDEPLCLGTSTCADFGCTKINPGAKCLVEGRPGKCECVHEMIAK